MVRVGSPSHLLSADSSAKSGLTENYMELNSLENIVSAFLHTPHVND